MAPTGLRLSEWLGRLARYLYLADLIPDCEILDLGCGSGLGCEFLANHGAQRVIGVDTDREAIADARFNHSLVNVDYMVGRYDALELEDQSVDLIWASSAELLRKRSVVGELRRVLRPEGHLVWSVTSADRQGATGGASYHELGDRLGEHFGAHCMIAVQPLAALTLVEYADGEPAVELDTSLSRLGGSREEVYEYVGVFGPRAEGARPFAVVQVPARDGIDTLRRTLGLPEVGGEVTSTVLETERRARQQAETALAELKLRLAELERAEPERETEPGVDTEVGMADDQPTLVTLGSERLAHVLSEHAVYVDKLETELSEAREYADELLEERGDLEADMRRLRGELDAEKARVETMRSQIGDWRDRVARAEGTLLRMGLERGEVTTVGELDEQAPAAAGNGAPAVAASLAEAVGAAASGRRAADAAASVSQAADAAASGRQAADAAASVSQADLQRAHERLTEAESLLSEQQVVAGEIETLVAEITADAERLSALEAQLAADPEAAGGGNAEVALLTIGLRSLKSRLREVADELAGARQEGQDELAGAVVRAIGKLRNFSRD